MTKEKKRPGANGLTPVTNPFARVSNLTTFSQNSTEQSQDQAPFQFILGSRPIAAQGLNHSNDGPKVNCRTESILAYNSIRYAQLDFNYCQPH